MRTRLTTGPSTVSIAGGPPPTVDRALGPVPHPRLTRHADPVIGAAMARAFAEIHSLEARRWRADRQQTALDRLTAALEHVNELGHHSCTPSRSSTRSRSSRAATEEGDTDAR